MPRAICACALLLLAAACGDEVPDVADGPAAAGSAAKEKPRALPARVRAVEPATKTEDPQRARTPAEWSRVLRDADSSDEERQRAVDALVAAGEASVPFLVDALRDENVSDAALSALARLGPAAVSAAPAVIERMRETKNWGEVHALSRMGPGAIPALAKAATDESPVVRSGAANVLMMLAFWNRQSPDAESARQIADALVLLASDHDERTRQVALMGLGHVWDARPGIEALLIAALADSSKSVRGSAASTLGYCPGDATAAAAALVRALDDPDVWVGFMAANALQQLGDRAGDARLKVLEFSKRNPRFVGHFDRGVGVDNLQAALVSDDPEIRRIAADALAGMGAKAGEAAPALLRSLDDTSPAVRTAALDALSAAGLSMDSAPKIRGAFAASEPSVRAAAARAMGRLPSSTDDVIGDLLRGLTDPAVDVRRESAIALGRLAARPDLCVKALVTSLDDADALVRASAATSLGAFGAAAADASPDLRRLLAHPDPWVRLGAATSLARIEPQAPETFDALAKLAIDANVDVRWRTVIALGTIARPEGVATLIDRLDDRDRRIRKAAAEALGRLGPIAADAVSALAAMEKARDAELAAAARAALERIRATR